MICDAFDVVIVPFPFTDLPISRKRPAVVLTAKRPYGEATGQCVIAMVTVAAQSSWPFDRPIIDTAAAGLNRPCVIRMKLFTVDQRLILAKTGTLAEDDRRSIKATLAELFDGAIE